MLLRQTKNLSPGARRASKGFRPATTLTEVLVAIFVMGIGLLALLSLFPLGALSMAQAIKDDQTAHAAKNAFAVAEMFNIHNDSYLYPAGTQNNLLITDAFVNPYPVPPLPGLVGLPQQTDPTKPSYPVYIDPYAFYFLGLGNQMVGQTLGNLTALGLPPGIGIPRRSLSFLTSSQATVRWFTLLDNIAFHDNALPYPSNALPGTVPVLRDNRYSWAYMLRRPKAGDPTVVDVSVVIYSGRSLSVLGETASSSVILGGYYDPTLGQVVPSTKFVDMPYPVGNPPPVRRGSWILDATVVIPTPQGLTPDPHGFFYRVVEVTDIGPLPSPPYQSGYNGLRLELQTNFKNQNATFTGAVTQPTPYGVLVVMENVVEVFEKGQGWKP